MKAIHNATPVPVKNNMTILLRPNISCRKKYSDEISIMIASKKGKIYFLLIVLSRVE
jgi:hypothetical protein